MLRRFFIVTCTFAACSSVEPAGVSPRDAALQGTKIYLDGKLADLATASAALCAAAPAPDADGWNATADAAAVNTMRTQWKNAETAYQHLEAAIGSLFSDLDPGLSGTYEVLTATVPDNTPFDDQGMTGMHAIERILWADSIPPDVVATEAALPGAVTPAFPQTLQQATDFKTKLCGRLVHDVTEMQTEFTPLTLDPAAAFQAVIGPVGQQQANIDSAALGLAPSRYAQFSLADLRAQADLSASVYALMRPWLLQQSQGAALDGAVTGDLAALAAMYQKLPGDALPPVPADWQPSQPSQADLQSDFGQLWSALHAAADPDHTDSLLTQLHGVEDALGIPH